MQKIAFCMQLNPGAEAEYKARHDALWPDLRDALRQAGVRDYSIHLERETGRLFATLWRSDGRAGRRFALAASLVVLLSVVALSTGQAVPLRLASALSEPTVPASLGTVRLVREPPAEAAYRAGQSGSLAVQGRVYSLREAGVVQGSLQLAVLAADVDTRSPRVRDEVVSGFAGGRFRPARIGEEHVYRLALAEQTLLLAFDPDGHRYALLAVRSSYAGADQLFAALLAFGRGDLEGETVPDVPIPDPRRGSSQ